MRQGCIEYDNSSFNLEKTLANIEQESSRKIILLEIMALVFSDGRLDPAENKIIDKIVTFFNLNPNLAIVYKEWSKSILALFIQGEALIHL